MIEALIKAGLTERQAAIYQTLLKKGAQLQTDLAAQAGLNRTSIFADLEFLVQEGLVVREPVGKRSRYSAVHPEKIVSWTEERTKIVSSALPELTALFAHSTVHATSDVFTGTKQIRGLYEEAFKSGEIWGFFSPDEFSDHFGKDFNQHLFRLLVRAGGYLREVVPYAQRDSELLRHSYRSGVVEARVSKSLPSSSVDLIVSSTTVYLFSLSKNTATRITDEEIALSIKALIQALWETSEKL